MIEGFHVDVSGEEIKAILLSRFEYHESKHAFYKAKAKEMAEAFAVPEEEESQMGKVSNRGGVQTLENSAKTHFDRMVFFKFAAAHVVVNDTYRLDTNDLTLLGIMSTNCY